MNGRRYDPTLRSGMERSVPTFFHGSTNVRASSLSGSFSEHLATQLAGLRFRLSNAMSTAWSLASFRRACRADRAVAHGIEIDFDESLPGESSGALLIVSADLLCDLGIGGDDQKRSQAVFRRGHAFLNPLAVQG